MSLRQRTKVEFFYGHGYVGENLWKQYEQACKAPADDGDARCLAVVDQVTKVIGDIRKNATKNAPSFNVYDVYRNCRPRVGSAAEDVLDFELSLEQRSTGEQEIEDAKATSRSDGSMPYCVPDLATYLNQEAVRNALHIPSATHDWKMCKGSEMPPYGRQHDVKEEMRLIAASGVRALLFYGDTDGQCDFLMGQKFPGIIGLKVKMAEGNKDQADRQPWAFDGRLAGFSTEYEEGLTFVTIRGVGHMVPLWAPAEAEHIVRSFIQNKPL